MNHHLVVIESRYVASMLSGRKTIECRFSKHRRSPYDCVTRGDALWLKLPGGPVVAFARVRRVTFVHPLTPQILGEIHSRYGSSIRAEPRFFADRRLANFASIIHLGRVRSLKPFRVSKRDRRAWVVLPGPPRATIPGGRWVREPRLSRGTES